MQTNGTTRRWIIGTVWAAALAAGAAGCALDYGDDDFYEAGDKLADEAGDAVTKSGTSYYVPVGTHDVATCDTIEGWAKDGDTTAAIQVHIYKGAPYPYGTHVQNVVASQYRGDLPFADKNHGFAISTPAAFKTGHTETVYIHAINVDGDGIPLPPGATNPLLNLTGKSICCGAGCGVPDPCLIDCVPEQP